MVARRVGLLASALAVLLFLGLAGQAAAATTGYNPYDSASIKASIKRALLDHTIAPNYVTFDITVTKTDGTAPTAKYNVFQTFNQPGKDPTDNPSKCQEEHFNSPEVPRGVYRCTAIVSGPGRWEFNGTVSQPGNLQHILKTVSITLNIVDAASLHTPDAAPQHRSPGKRFVHFVGQAHGAVAGGLLLLTGVLVFLPHLRRKAER